MSSEGIDSLRSVTTYRAENRLVGSLPFAKADADSGMHSLLRHMAMHVAFHLICGPLVLFVGAIFVAGVWGLFGKIDELRGGRGHGAELWPCLLAAVVLVVITLFVYRYFRTVRQRTIREFEYDEGQFNFRTSEGDLWTSQTAALIRSIGECPGTRDCVRIKFADGRWAVVMPQLENGNELLQRLSRDTASYQYRST